MGAPEIEMYTADYCGFCRRAKALLEKKGVSWREIAVEHDAERRMEMVQRSGRHTVPQIFINGRHIGGFDDIHALDRQGKLDELLSSGDASSVA